MFLNRLAEYQSFYLQSRSIEDFDKLKDDMLLNYFMHSLKDNVVEFVKSRQPQTANEAAASADLCYSVKGKSQAQGHVRYETNSKNHWVKQQGSRPAKPQEPKTGDEAVAASAVSVAKNAPKVEQHKMKGCWSCGSLSHKRADCPTSAQPNTRKGKRSDQTQSTAFVASHSRQNADSRFVVPCYVMGRRESFTAYRDSGASVSLASAHLVDESAYTGNQISVRGIFGPEVKIPTAVIRIKSPKFRFSDYVSLEVGVVDSKLSFDVHLLLGNNLFDGSSRVLDVIRIDDLRCERSTCIQPLINSTVQSPDVVSDVCVDQTANLSSSAETFFDQSMQCNLSGNLAELTYANEGIAVVTRSKSVQADPVRDTPLELTSDEINVSSTDTTLNNACRYNAHRSEISADDGRVSQSTSGKAQRGGRPVSSKRRQTTAPPVFGNVISRATSHPMEGEGE
jgi:hypothetical protein